MSEYKSLAVYPPTAKHESSGDFAMKFVTKGPTAFTFASLPKDDLRPESTFFLKPPLPLSQKKPETIECPRNKSFAEAGS